MRETRFINENKDKWKDFEQVLEGEHRDPDRLSELLVQLTDDLSYSRTAYPNRLVRLYLNRLAQSIFLKIHRHRPAPWRKIGAFWQRDLPASLYESRRALQLSVGVFLLSFAIGLLSSAMDPEFARIVLGDAYIEMTKANIASGDPMAVYKQRGEFDMFLGITLNNLLVACLTFVMGVFWGLGTLVILIRNAVMIGAFQYFFIEQGLFWESFLTIWIHGTLEISAIVIAGSAGLTMGKGLAFPGTYSLMQSFQRSARRGIQIMIGIVPLFLVAGFLEAYLTRHTDTPDPVRGLFILSCLLFVLAYFGWLPRRQARLGIRPAMAERRVHERRFVPELQSIKRVGQEFSETFGLLFGISLQWLWYVLGAAFVLCIGALGLRMAPPDTLFVFQYQGLLAGLLNLGHLLVFRPLIGWMPVVHVLLLNTLAWLAFRMLASHDHSLPAGQGKWYALLLPTSVWVAGMSIDENLSLLWVLTAGPICLLWMYVAYREGGRRSLSRTFALLSGQYLQLVSLQALLILLGTITLIFFNALLLDIIFDWANWIVSADQPTLDQWSVILLTMINGFLLFFLWMWLSAAAALQYHVLLEIKEAPGLKAQIAQIGLKRNIRGLERE